MSDENEKSSWLGSSQEDYPAEGDMTGKRMLVAASTVVVLAIFGGLIWYSYLKGNDQGPVPVVHADKSVVKVKPDNPGGLQVPDQDKRVFDRVTPGPSEKSAQLSSSAELPLERPLGSKPPTGGVKKIIVGGKTGVVKKIVPTHPVTQSVKRPTKRAATVPVGNYLIQLGAFGREKVADALWRRLKKGNISVLGNLESDIMMIDLGKRGVLYRLRAGMIADKAAATNICTRLKAKKQACIVVRK